MWLYSCLKPPVCYLWASSSSSMITWHLRFSMACLSWWLRWKRVCLQCGRPGFNPWVGKTPWRRDWLPTQYSCLESSMDRRAWRARVHAVAKRQIQLTFTEWPNAVLWISLVQFSHLVVSDSLRPHEPQHARPPCPSPTPRVYSNPCPLSRWCHPVISSSVIPFSSHLQSFPASGSFQMSQLFASGGQSIGVSASPSVLPMNTQDWSALGWTGWISLQSKGLSRVFSNTTLQKHQFFLTQLSL